MPVKLHTKALQRIVATYRAAGQEWPASTHDIANWALRERLSEPRESDVIGVLADQLARAMREEYYTDPQGREVRAKHAAKVCKNGKQLTLWDDIRTADRAHMETAFQQRRSQIVGDCKQLKTDVTSYNQNRNPGPSIQLNLDFTRDVAEAEAAESLIQGVSPPAPSRPSSRSRTAVLTSI